MMRKLCSVVMHKAILRDQMLTVYVCKQWRILVNWLQDELNFKLK